MGVYEDVRSSRAGARTEGWELDMWEDWAEGIVHKKTTGYKNCKTAFRSQFQASVSNSWVLCSYSNCQPTDLATRPNVEDLDSRSSQREAVQVKPTVLSVATSTGLGVVLGVSS